MTRDDRQSTTVSKFNGLKDHRGTLIAPTGLTSLVM